MCQFGDNCALASNFGSGCPDNAVTCVLGETSTGTTEAAVEETTESPVDLVDGECPYGYFQQFEIDNEKCYATRGESVFELEFGNDLEILFLNPESMYNVSISMSTQGNADLQLDTVGDDAHCFIGTTEDCDYQAPGTFNVDNSNMNKAW